MYPWHVARSGYIGRCILLMLSMHDTYLVTIPNRIAHASGKLIWTGRNAKSYVHKVSQKLGFLGSLDQHEMPAFLRPVSSSAAARLDTHAMMICFRLLAMQMDSKVTARSLCLSSYPRRACVSLSSNCQDFLTLSPSPCCWVDLRSWLTWGRRHRVSLALSPIVTALQ